MDDTIALLLAYAMTVVAFLAYLYFTNPTPREKIIRLDNHARGLSERTFADIIEASNRGHNELVLAMQGHLERMTTPVEQHTSPPQPTPGAEYAFGQAMDEVGQFHDTMGGTPIEDTPDWTDHMFPNERTDEPRVATIRPGDSIIPGQGNWDEMTAEGRVVENGGVHSGEEQWSQ